MSGQENPYKAGTKNYLIWEQGYLAALDDVAALMKTEEEGEREDEADEH